MLVMMIVFNGFMRCLLVRLRPARGQSCVQWIELRAKILAQREAKHAREKAERAQERKRLREANKRRREEERAEARREREAAKRRRVEEAQAARAAQRQREVQRREAYEKETAAVDSMSVAEREAREYLIKRDKLIRTYARHLKKVFADPARGGAPVAALILFAYVCANMHCSRYARF